MIDLVYKVLKGRLAEQSPELKYVDWYLGQPEDDAAEGLVRATPCAFVEFGPIQWQDVNNRIQKASVDIIIHDVGSSMFEDDRRLIGSTDHLLFANKTYLALRGFSAALSDVSGLEFLKGTKDDAVLINTMTRARTFTDQNLTRFVRTMQDFSTTIWDYSASPKYVEILAQLDLKVDKK